MDTAGRLKQRIERINALESLSADPGERDVIARLVSALMEIAQLMPSKDKLPISETG